MLEVEKNGFQTDNIKSTKPKDIIVERVWWETEVNDNGDIIQKRKTKLVNLTQKILETSKLIKERTAQEKLNELEKIFTK